MEQSWLSDFLENEDMTAGDRVAIRYNEGKEVLTVTGMVVRDPADPNPRLLTILPDTEPGSTESAQNEERLVIMQISYDKIIASMMIVTKKSFLASLEDEE